MPRPGLAGVQPPHGDQTEPQVADFGQYPVQRGLVSEQAANDRLLALAADLEAAEPSGPPAVEHPRHADLVPGRPAHFCPSLRLCFLHLCTVGADAGAGRHPKVACEWNLAVMGGPIRDHRSRADRAARPGSLRRGAQPGSIAVPRTASPQRAIAQAVVYSWADGLTMTHSPEPPPGARRHQMTHSGSLSRDEPVGLGGRSPVADPSVAGPAGTAMSGQDALLATKLHVPQPRPGFVPRQRLVEAL